MRRVVIGTQSSGDSQKAHGFSCKVGYANGSFRTLFSGHITTYNTEHTQSGVSRRFLLGLRRDEPLQPILLVQLANSDFGECHLELGAAAALSAFRQIV